MGDGGNGERPMDLRRVAPVADSELGYDDATFFENSRSLLLPRNETVWAGHVSRRDEVNARVAAVFDVGAVNDRQDVLFRQAGTQIVLQRFTGKIGQETALAEIHQFFFATHSTNAAELRTKINEFSFGELALQLADIAIGHGAHADEADSTFGQIPTANFFHQRGHWHRSVPANVRDDRLCLGARLVVEEVDEDRCFSFAWKEQPAGGLC